MQCHNADVDVDGVLGVGEIHTLSVSVNHTMQDVGGGRE